MELSSNEMETIVHVAGLVGILRVQVGHVKFEAFIRYKHRHAEYSVVQQWKSGKRYELEIEILESPEVDDNARSMRHFK